MKRNKFMYFLRKDQEGNIKGTKILFRIKYNYI